MLRQIASMAAFAIVASPLLPLAQAPASATQPQHKPGHEKQCVQVKLDRYDYRGEIRDGGNYWDRLYFDWHVDCYNQDRPPYEVYVTAYYGDKYYSETYRGNLSDYTFKVRKPNGYAGKKPTYVKIVIKVVGNQGTYQYKNDRITL
jgi:hypothetical protein